VKSDKLFSLTRLACQSVEEDIKPLCSCSRLSSLPLLLSSLLSTQFGNAPELCCGLIQTRTTVISILVVGMSLPNLCYLGIAKGRFARLLVGTVNTRYRTSNIPNACAACYCALTCHVAPLLACRQLYTLRDRRTSLNQMPNPVAGTACSG